MSKYPLCQSRVLCNQSQEGISVATRSWQIYYLYNWRILPITKYCCRGHQRGGEPMVSQLLSWLNPDLSRNSSNAALWFSFHLLSAIDLGAVSPNLCHELWVKGDTEMRVWKGGDSCLLPQLIKAILFYTVISPQTQWASTAPISSASSWLLLHVLLRLY